MTKSEQVLQAVLARLETIEGAKVVRNADRPISLENQPGGMIILRDGTAGDPEVLLSPPSYLYDHRAEIEIHVQKGGKSARIATLDERKKDVGLALAVDRTFGGLCDWSTPEAPEEPNDAAPEGAATITGMLIPLILTYETSDPLA